MLTSASAGGSGLRLPLRLLIGEASCVASSVVQCMHDPDAATTSMCYQLCSGTWERVDFLVATYGCCAQLWLVSNVHSRLLHMRSNAAKCEIVKMWVCSHCWEGPDR
jgi:hypothetical protein